MSDPQRPHGLQPSRLLSPWDFPGRSTGVGCHCLLPILLAAAAKLLQSCLTLCNPIDGSPPGPTIPGILQARTLEWVAISSSTISLREEYLYKLFGVSLYKFVSQLSLFIYSIMYLDYVLVDISYIFCLIFPCYFIYFDP